MPHLKSSPTTGHLLRKTTAGDKHLAKSCTQEPVCNITTGGYITLNVAGVNASRCGACQDYGAFGWKISNLAVDGNYTVDFFQNVGGVLEFFEEITVTGVLTALNYSFGDNCATLNATCTFDIIEIYVKLDCNNIDGDGDPRIEEIYIRLKSTTCNTANVAQFMFYYNRPTCGGTYYWKDALPNGGPVGHDCDPTVDPGCKVPAGHNATGGTVTGI